MGTNRDPRTQRGAEVTADFQLEVHASVANPLHWHSSKKKNSFIVYGTSDTLTAAKVPVLYVKNTSTDLDLVVENLHGQTVAEAATIPAVGIFWTLDRGAVVTGGTAVTPQNMNTAGVSNSPTTVLHSTPTIDTVGTQLLRIYAQGDGDVVEIEGSGGFIVGPDGTLTLSYTTTGSAGIATAVLYFYMEAQGAG